MGTYDESILTETKKVLGLAEADTTFDTDIRMHINSAFGTLNQLGIGPDNGFEIVDKTSLWADFLLSDLQLSPVKSYVHLRVKLLFDPPATSWTAVAMKEQIEQLEWRLNLVREDTIPYVAPSLDEDEDDIPIDEEVPYNFTIKAGSTLEPVVFEYLRVGTDFTGWTAQLQARRSVTSTTTILDVTPTLDGSIGAAIITLSLTALETGVLPTGTFPYALEITHPSDEPVIRIIEGLITVDPEIVR